MLVQLTLGALKNHPLARVVVVVVVVVVVGGRRGHEPVPQQHKRRPVNEAAQVVLTPEVVDVHVSLVKPGLKEGVWSKSRLL